MPSCRLRSMASLISCTWPRRGLVADVRRVDRFPRRRAMPMTRRWLMTAFRFSARFIRMFLCEASGRSSGCARWSGRRCLSAGWPGTGDGLGERNRRLHRVHVADRQMRINVRRLAYGVLQRLVVAVGVQTHLALVDDRLLVPVQEIRSDPSMVRMWTGTAAVAVVDHRRQRGRLARAGGADHEDQAARFHDQRLEDRRQQAGPPGDLALDGADDHAHFAALLER